MITDKSRSTVSEQRVRRPASDDSAAATPTLALDALRDYSRRARAAAAFVDPPGALTDALDKLDALIAHAAEPIVRTVGDLTARHRGKRVRVKASISRPACRGQWIIGTLDEIFVEVGELGITLDAASIEGADHGDYLWCPYLAYGTDELDTPCEVLP